jgi:hypothetical protein
MEPTTSRSGTTGAEQTAEGQSLSPQTNVNQGTQRSNTATGAIPGSNRITNQEGASFSGPGNQGNQGTQQQQQQQQAGYPGSNSS